MTLAAIATCIGCQFLLVIGQLFLKRAMAGSSDAAHQVSSSAPSRARRATHLALGIACLSAWFFLWLGILQRFELSHVFAFEGLNPALLVIGAAVLLRERVPPSGWIGVGLICVGIVLVSKS